ncbi:hypothetical protein M9458_005996, partial [Cirrhinus mrigala]
VKIWFQNKRSKYKKIMKHGSGGPEGEHLQAASASGTPCSPGMPPLWDVSMSSKGAPIHSGGYMNSFGHWYPGHHQDPMARTQMILQCIHIPSTDSTHSISDHTSPY